MATSNATKHGGTFEEAHTVFDDDGVRIEVQKHAGELHMAAIGYSRSARVVFVEVTL